MGLNGGGAEVGLQETQRPRTEDTGTQTEDLASCRNALEYGRTILLAIPQVQGDGIIQDLNIVRKIAVRESELVKLAEEKNWRIVKLTNKINKQDPIAPLLAALCQDSIAPEAVAAMAEIPNYP